MASSVVTNEGEAMELLPNAAIGFHVARMPNDPPEYLLVRSSRDKRRPLRRPRRHI